MTTYTLTDDEFGTVTHHDTFRSAYDVGQFVSAWSLGVFTIRDDRGMSIGTFRQGSFTLTPKGDDQNV